jgi:hypothetical protein
MDILVKMIPKPFMEKITKMNDMIVFGTIFAGVAACLLAFCAFHIYRGVQGSLACANIGDVYNFEYLQPKQGIPERYMVKVVGVQTLTDKQISKLNATSNYRRYDEVFQRTNHLITGQSVDGTIRNFYAERVVNCRRPLLGKPLFQAGLAHLFF